MIKRILFLLKTILMFPIRLFSKISPFALVRNSNVDKTSSIGFNCRIYDCEVGRYTYIGKHTIACNTQIGNFCSVADNCFISPGKHPLNMISSSPVFYARKNPLRKSFRITAFQEFDPVFIGNDVWIGTHAFIKGGVKIGDGAVIGAYSIVTKDIEPYTVVAGNPAKVIRKRFEDKKIKMLLNSKWWNRSDSELLKLSKYFINVDQFQEEYIKGNI